MKMTLPIALLLILLSAFHAYSQDSSRTINDKPGTPQSLQRNDDTPQSHVQVTNTTAPNQTNQPNVNRPSESNTPNNTSQQTITVDPNTPARRNPVKPNTINRTPPATMQTTTNSSAVQNGISNSSKPLRNN